MRLKLLAVICVTISLSTTLKAADTFPLKDGDVWVMAGDSITAQKLHSNYFEAFCYARYPKLKFAFRNSGVGGDTIPKVLARFDHDVAGWKPTVISVELGMNDQGQFPADKFIENMAKLHERIKASGARPVYFSPSPINNGGTTKNYGGNAKLNLITEALKKFAEAQNAPFADQFHAVIDVWGANNPRESLANLRNVIQAELRNEKLVGAEHLKAFLQELSKDPKPPVSMQGDPVHPGAPGQLIMAAALLKELKAEGFVSSVTLDAQGKVVESKACIIEDIKVENDALTFTRLDETIAFPIPDETRDVLPLFPTILDLSQCMLKVTGLQAERYNLIINGAGVALLSAKELADGVNLTQYPLGPIAAQGKAVLAAVSSKEGIVSNWRGMSRSAAIPTAPPEVKTQLAELTKRTEDADEKIRATAKPIKMTYQILPMK